MKHYKYNVSPDNLSIIFQGPIFHEFTLKAIKTTRKVFPESEIILSTYNGSDVTNLMNYIDRLVTIEDPGFDYHFFGYSDYNLRTNIYRMISTSLNGIQKSTKKFAVKLRSDTILHNREILNLYNSLSSQAMEFSNKIMVSKIMDENYLDEFFIGDWFQMGLRSDLEKLYQAAYKLANNNHSVRKLFTLKSRLVPEYFLWNSLYNDLNYLSSKDNYRLFIEKNICLMNNSYNKFILVQKYPNLFKNSFFAIRNISYKRSYEVNEKGILNFIKARFTKFVRLLNYLKKRLLK